MVSTVMGGAVVSAVVSSRPMYRVRNNHDLCKTHVDLRAYKLSILDADENYRAVRYYSNWSCLRDFFMP